MNNSVRRSLVIMNLLAETGEPMRLADVARATDTPKSTALDILRTLVAERFLETEGGDRYRLGLRAFEVGAAYLRGVSPSTAAHSELVRLAHELRVTAHFAILEGAEVLYLEKEDPPHPDVRLASAVGIRLPAHHTAVGQAQLAELSDSDLIRHVGEGPLPVGEEAPYQTLAQLRAGLAEVRRRGFAIDAGYTREHVQCVAAPVIDADRQCRGAIGVSFLKRRGGPQTNDVADAVVAGARRVSERLGFREEVR